MTTAAFRKIVWDFYEKEGRHDLPWRKTQDPYRILVSEVMLQQTQVERVRAYYAAWMKEYPTAKSLAAAPLGGVLRAWQGLGYNRRAKMLHAAAQAVTEQYKGKMPASVEELEKLPGVGPYTARAIAAFSNNADVAFVETNVRTVILHHFFPGKAGVTDSEVLQKVQETFPKGRAREWYAALMDYGSFLKRSGVRNNAKSKHYAKQSTFAGSDRQARGAIVKELAKGAAPAARLLGLLGDDRTEQLSEQLAKLAKEGMVTREGRKYRLP